MNDDRLKREREFHDERFGGDDRSRSAAEKYYSIAEAPRAQYTSIISRHCRGRELLEWGCGTGIASIEWLRRGAIVTGIDISPEAVRKAAMLAEDNGLKATYHVMNAEQTSFPDRRFDVVIGNGVIHHLDLTAACAELSRILKPDGHAVFIEPLGHNMLINLYRRLTPSMRTEDEHPLKLQDVRLFDRYFSRVAVHYYNLCTIAAVPFRNTGLFKPVVGFLRRIDNALFRLPPFRKYAWTVVLHMQGPKS